MDDWFFDFIIYFPQATNNNSFYLIREISSRITNSHKVFYVVDVGGVPFLELFLSGHLYHLILFCSVEPAVPVVNLAVEPEPVAQAVLLLGGFLGVSLGEQPGADAVGPA